MRIALSPELRAHRRGRFLASLLGIAAADEQSWPDSGLVLATGEQVQLSAASRDAYPAWVRQPERAVLLVPPYKIGPVLPCLDWEIRLAPPGAGVSSLAPDSLDGLLAGEISHLLLGRDGSPLPSGTTRPDCPTRYWKAHANSGLIAATTLPLWSISLLDRADAVRAFLAGIAGRMGKTSNNPSQEEAAGRTGERPVPVKLAPEDITILVCCHGFALQTAAELEDRLGRTPVPLLSLDRFHLPESFQRLREAGMLGDQGVTTAGLELLDASPYRAYAEYLKGESRP